MEESETNKRRKGGRYTPIACDRCKIRHRKCNGKQPCSNCVKGNDPCKYRSERISKQKNCLEGDDFVEDFEEDFERDVIGKKKLKNDYEDSYPRKMSKNNEGVGFYGVRRKNLIDEGLVYVPEKYREDGVDGCGWEGRESYCGRVDYEGFESRRYEGEEVLEKRELSYKGSYYVGDGKESFQSPFRNMNFYTDNSYFENMRSTKSFLIPRHIENTPQPLSQHIKPEGMQDKYDYPPVKYDYPPVKYDYPPVKYDYPPVKYDCSPSKSEVLPEKYENYKFDDYPSIKSENFTRQPFLQPLSQIHIKPQVIQDKYDYPPVKYDCSPSKSEDLPEKYENFPPRNIEIDSYPFTDGIIYRFFMEKKNVDEFYNR